MKYNEKRILVIGDLHEPFCLDGYLDFCKQTFKDFNCNQVVFIGDVTMKQIQMAFQVVRSLNWL
jgi:predicted phosphodiesterase